ncbi:MAG: DUF5320 domain-containing protein [Deltaproteobacteria bacterium]|nr:DUF5320 domain-containing protein [Deltaproteobacteria bacterium]
MPGGDRTGPLGMGPGTGRRAGFCSGYNMPGYMNSGPAREFAGGFGPGMGNGGHGWRNWCRATGRPGWMRSGWNGDMPGAAAWSPDGEKQVLEQQLQGLEYELGRIKRRLSEISTVQQEEK